MGLEVLIILERRLCWVSMVALLLALKQAIDLQDEQTLGVPELVVSRLCFGLLLMSADSEEEWLAH